jgi:hypothetical protein
MIRDLSRDVSDHMPVVTRFYFEEYARGGERRRTAAPIRDAKKRRKSGRRNRR